MASVSVSVSVSNEAEDDGLIRGAVGAVETLVICVVAAAVTGTVVCEECPPSVSDDEGTCGVDDTLVEYVATGAVSVGSDGCVSDDGVEMGARAAEEGGRGAAEVDALGPSDDE